ncbi:ATP-binding protein [Desulfurococcaceae archaeon MEX13E-LK6-19]|nr:ATP-binding protein [Desulfurococcaceae archaeon MEX13E-LK6-19]
MNNNQQKPSEISWLALLVLTLIVVLINVYSPSIIQSSTIFTLDYISVLMRIFTVFFIIPFIIALILMLISRSFLLGTIYFLLQLIVFTGTLSHQLKPVPFIEIFYIIILVLMAPAISIMYKMKKYRVKEDTLISLLKDRQKFLDLNLDSISQLALHLCISGIILFILTFLNISVPSSESIYVTGILLILPITSILTMLSKRINTTLQSSIVLATSWYGVPAIPLLLASLGTGHGLAFSNLYKKKIILGNKQAILVYDKPRRIYTKINQDPIIEKVKHTRRKTWFWQETRGELSIDLESIPNMHISIFGASGMGKSILAKSIIFQAYKNYGYSFLVLDHHNEYLDLMDVLGKDLNILDSYKASINPFELDPNTSPKQRAIELADTIKSIFNLGYIQRNALEEIFIKTYELKGILTDDPSTWSKQPPNFGDVLDVIDNFISEGIYEDQYKRIRPYIKMLTQDVFAETKISFHEILTKPTIILLASLPSDQVRAMYVDTFLHRLIRAMYTTTISNKILLVIDEAHLLFKRNRSRALVNRLFMESRKYGLGILAITQQPLDTSEAVIVNSSIKIVFGLTEIRNLDYISKTLSGYTDYSKVYAVKLAISSLGKLNAVTIIDNTLYIIDTSHSLSILQKFPS